MRVTLNITGTLSSEPDAAALASALANIGMDAPKIQVLPHYEDWKTTLPTGSIPELSAACLDWIHHWGNGGGDYSSEDCITNAILDLESDVPGKLADAIFGSVADYCKSMFEAIGLTTAMIDECIQELSQETENQELEEAK